MTSIKVDSYYYKQITLTTGLIPMGLAFLVILSSAPRIVPWMGRVRGGVAVASYVKHAAPASHPAKLVFSVDSLKRRKAQRPRSIQK
jgi:hypothetical protein